MSACLAIEAACGIEVTAPIADLRRLLYCGEWIESHALHIYLLHAPDFLGYTSALALAEDRHDLVERGLALKKAGNAIMELVGGRAIHPVNVRVGGFYRAPGQARDGGLGREAARRAGPGTGHRALGGRVRVPRLPSRPRDAGPGHARAVRHRPGHADIHGRADVRPGGVRGSRDRGARTALDGAARPAGRAGPVT